MPEVDPRIVAAYEALVKLRNAAHLADVHSDLFDESSRCITGLADIIKEGEPAIPLESSAEAATAIDAMLKVYQYPGNTTNAARAGWRAARLMGKQPQQVFAAVSTEHMRREWVMAGGGVHGPRVETVTMPEANYFEFRRSLSLNSDESFITKIAGYESEADRISVQLATSNQALRAAQGFILRAYQWDSDGPGKYPTLHTIAQALGDPIVERTEGEHPL